MNNKSKKIKKINKMSKEEKASFEEWWIEFENTDGIVNFCNDQLKYVAELAFQAGNSNVLNEIIDERKRFTP